MEVIFFLLRLPFFLIGFVLWTLLIFIIMPFVAFWHLFLKPLGWMFFVVPFTFLCAAFENRIETFTSHVKEAVANWKKDILEGVRDLLSSYDDLFRWLFEGSKTET